MSDKVFVDGMIVKRNAKAPDFVVAGLSIKVEDFAKFVKENANNGWLNIDLMKSQGGKMYAQLNTFKPGDKASTETNDSDLPF